MYYLATIKSSLLRESNLSHPTKKLGEGRWEGALPLITLLTIHWSSFGHVFFIQLAILLHCCIVVHNKIIITIR